MMCEHNDDTAERRTERLSRITRSFSDGVVKQLVEDTEAGQEIMRMVPPCGHDMSLCSQRKRTGARPSSSCYSAWARLVINA